MVKQGDKSKASKNKLNTSGCQMETETAEYSSVKTDKLNWHFTKTGGYFIYMYVDVYNN